MFNSPSGGSGRPAMHAGTFYPADPSELEAMINRYLKKSARLSIAGDILGIMVPHAGYVYSGPTAAAAYKQVQKGDYQSAVVLAPSHRELLRKASVFERDWYETPLGRIAVNKELAEAIVAGDKNLVFSERGHEECHDRAEHSLEVQLPFVQCTLPGISIVPIVISDSSLKVSKEIGEAIARAVAGERVLLIASSDLYHGYSYESCLAADAQTLAALEEFTPERFGDGISSGYYQACGGGPVTVMLFATRALGADTVKVIARTNSADVTGMRGGYVVGYGAALVYRS